MDSLMNTITIPLQQARKAKKDIASLDPMQRSVLLNHIASRLVSETGTILEANQKDLAQFTAIDARYDRMQLTPERILDLASSVRAVALLPNPVDQLLLRQTLPNGLKVEKKTVPLGVVGVIYEARPNVTIDVAALCIQSGNVCVLRGSSDAWYTNSVLVQIIREVLRNQSLNVNIVQLLPTDRDLVYELLQATSFVDVIIPRGSQSLIDFVRLHAKVPVIETGAGVCHTYVERTADLDMAARIVANAKISRPSVCNALDTILLDKEITPQFIPQLIPFFKTANVEVYADEYTYLYFAQENYPFLKRAQGSDFGREFLDFKCAVKAVENSEEAMEHIERYSSKHSECIISTDPESIALFMNTVDAAAVYSNASTRFTDGGEFGLGAEIGISTQKLHARGPFALEKLVTEKWFVTGSGQIR